MPFLTLDAPVSHPFLTRFSTRVSPVSHPFLTRFSPVSQAKLSKLFKPPKMHVGELYAATVKTAAMGLMYGILYPPAYLITSFAMMISYWGTRCGISYWFRRPPTIDTDMLDRMIVVLACVQASESSKPLACVTVPRIERSLARVGALGRV